MKLLDKIRDKSRTYDKIIASKIGKNTIFPMNRRLNNREISLGYNNTLESKELIRKYFVISYMPDYMDKQLIDIIRNACLVDGVVINQYIYCEPHKIQWDKPQLRSRLRVMRDTVNEQEDTSVFEYRENRSKDMSIERNVKSLRYYFETELDNKRTLEEVVMVFEFVGNKDAEGVDKISESIDRFKKYCAVNDIRYKDTNLLTSSWMDVISPFKMRYDGKDKMFENSIPKRVLSDDILANMTAYKQGRVGTGYFCMGMDIYSRSPVFYQFKKDPNSSDNWLIVGETGSGKSFYVKSLLTYFMANNFTVTIMDYEGDEYTPFANYIASGNPEDVKVISMGKGSSVYFDPMEIAELTGDVEVDQDLKESAISSVIAIFRIIQGKDFNKWQEKIVSNAIKNVYMSNGVTDDMSTWGKSRGLSVKDVYEEIKREIDCGEFVDESSNNVKQIEAMNIVEMCSIYFEEGESKSGVFKNPMSINELYKAKLIVFQFGMRGATSSSIDPVVLALKQMSVANVSIQISNYCKYVKHTFNVKLWEEYQRWGEVEGSAEIIVNAMTGGRKRGDVNLLITNNLASILDENNSVAKALSQNFQGKIIGKIRDADIRAEFCRRYEMEELKEQLDLIAKSRTGSTYNSIYKHAFVFVINDSKAVVKAKLPTALATSNIFKTGVDLDGGKQ